MSIFSKQQSPLNWNGVFVKHSKRLWEPMLRFAASLTNSAELADDVLQTSLLKALKAFPRFSKKNFLTDIPTEADLALEKEHFQLHFKNWLYRIVKNTYLDERAESSKWIFDPDEKSIEAASANDFQALASDVNLLSGENSADFAKEEKEFYRLALDDGWKKRLELLSDRQRSILFLAAEDYAYKEIASILNIPIGTVMSNLSRALQKLKKGEESSF